MAEEIAVVVSEVVSRQLLGELLTIIDAGSSDKVQRDAMKSLVRQQVQKCHGGLIARLTVESKEAGKATKSTKHVEA